MPSLDIIIVNWNAGEYLRQCVESIAASKPTDFGLNRVVVIDNASSDGSVDNLDFPGLPLTLLQNKGNRGFAAACNQGAKGSDADYLLFLNPDTRLSRNSLSAAVECLSAPEQKQTGILGIQLVDESGVISRSCARFPTAGRFLTTMVGLDRIFPKLFKSHFMTDWDHRDSREVDQVMGAFFMVRTPLFRKLGGLDERFFVYFEEVDFAMRARGAGFRSYFLAGTSAYHRGGGTTDHIRATRLFYSLRSRILFSYKHFHVVTGTVVALSALLIEPFVRILFAISRGSGKTVIETVKGYARLWSVVPRLVVGGGRNMA